MLQSTPFVEDCLDLPAQPQLGAGAVSPGHFRQISSLWGGYIEAGPLKL
jgi:hypothetical protein